MNKQSSWQECINTNATRIRTPDTQKAQSLTKIANQRQEFLLSTPLSQKNANFIFEGLYSCLIEHLHAHLLKQGYHVLNHICLGYYLRDILSRADLYEQFTTLRVRRNNLIYYGKQMPFEVAQESTRISKTLINIFQNL